MTLFFFFSFSPKKVTKQIADLVAPDIYLFNSSSVHIISHTFTGSYINININSHMLAIFYFITLLKFQLNHRSLHA